MNIMIIILAGLLLGILALVAIIFLAVPIAKGVAAAVGRVFGFIAGTVTDTLKLLGALVTSLVFSLLVLGTIIIGRWSASAHFGRAVQAELTASGQCLYRLFVGNPARLLFLEALTEGIEKRLPQVLAQTPGRDKPKSPKDRFDGYEIIGSLKAGGSGGKLYVAKPSHERLLTLHQAGHKDIDKVVIKVFSLTDGSSLPQIVRENRSLPAARRLGLILEHQLDEHRFFYVMRYVPGESLGIIAQNLHAQSPADGLDDNALSQIIGYTTDLLRVLATYHRGGLWHKDVKPDNIIVSSGKANLVDFGLITPLASSMTLTTHGTEYFRDPEMVRMALRGVKVHEVSSAKFDIYAAGAVLYSLVENSFPAHGGLSQISKRCPESIRWIVRRAMTDYDKRYDSADDMLADLNAVANAENPFDVKPVMLPSFSGSVPAQETQPEPVAHPATANEETSGREHEHEPVVVAAAASPVPPWNQPSPARERAHDAQPSRAARPRIVVTNWWTGKYRVVRDASRRAHAPAHPAPVTAGQTVEVNTPENLYTHHDAETAPARAAGYTPLCSAKEQRKRARARVEAARNRARAKIHERRRKDRNYTSLNLGVGIAVVLFFASATLVTLALGLLNFSKHPAAVEAASSARSMRVQLAVLTDDLLDRADDRSTDVLVLRDSATYDPEHDSAALSMLTNLVARNINPIGETPIELHEPSTDTDNTRPEHQELAATLRNRVGLQPFLSASAADSISTWLDTNSNIDAVLWIGLDDDKHLTAWLLPHNDAPYTVAEALEDATAEMNTPSQNALPDESTAD